MMSGSMGVCFQLGFSYVLCPSIHADEHIDGEAIALVLATCSDPHYLKDLLPMFGQRVKVYSVTKLTLGSEMAAQV